MLKKNESNKQVVGEAVQAKRKTNARSPKQATSASVATKKAKGNTQSSENSKSRNCKANENAEMDKEVAQRRFAKKGLFDRLGIEVLFRTSDNQLFAHKMFAEQHAIALGDKTIEIIKK